MSAANETVFDSHTTACAIVGGGPAGMVLAYILAHSGTHVTLLEMHGDFDRDFRGDTLHPSILEIMDELGLAERLLQLPHTKIRKFAIQGPAARVEIADLDHLKTKFPFIALMPQAQFLAFLAKEAQHFSCFHLRTGAMVDGLISEKDTVCGVRYRTSDGERELRALLTVGADGRFSRVRKLSGLDATAVKMSQPMDVLWLRLPRHADETHGLMGRIGNGHVLVELDRGHEWQIGLIIPKGSYAELHGQGVDALRRLLAETDPTLADRVHALEDWKQVSLLTVQADRLTRWYKPGLLLIGDAAHVMSPAGGNGINYAVADAVAAGNVLTGPLRVGHVTLDDLARVQRRRERPTRIIQTMVNFAQDNVLERVLDSKKPFEVPGIVRVRPLANLLARVIAFGISPEHVKNEKNLVVTN